MRRSPLIMITGVYAILDLPYAHTIEPSAIAWALIAGGAQLVQLRAKTAAPQARRRCAEAIAGVCHAAGVALIINDDLELAEAGIPGLVGVHLGQSDLRRLGPDLATRSKRREQLRARGLALGISTHDLAQLRQAVSELEPDYLGFGPVFATASKRDHDPIVGIETLALACRESPVPVVAIGGIDATRAIELAQTGVAAIAAIGALTGETVGTIRERTCALTRAFAV